MLGKVLTIATIHTTAYTDNVIIRKKEISSLIETIKNEDFLFDSLIIVGDLNLHQSKEDETLRDCKLIDVWKEIQVEDGKVVEGYTYDSIKNVLIQKLFFGFETRRMRLDRITLYDGSCWHPTDIQITANEPINDKGTLFCSDHFGLVSQFEEKDYPFIANNQELETMVDNNQSRKKNLKITIIIIFIFLILFWSVKILL